MPFHAFSSLILREVIREIGMVGEGIHLNDQDWAEAVEAQHGLAAKKQPVVFLTPVENEKAIMYLSYYKFTGLDLAKRATHLMRDEHAADIKAFLKAKFESQGSDDLEFTEIPNEYLPSGDGPLRSLKEWIAINIVWRLAGAMPGLSFQDAEFGTPDCSLDPLPYPWIEKLNDIMQITDAILPVPKAPGGFFTRRALDSILPKSDTHAHRTGLLDSKVIDRWFQILVSHRNRTKSGQTFFIHPDSLDVVGTSPQEVVEKAFMVNADADIVLFPTVITEKDHCILVAVFPHRYTVVVYDPLGSKSTKTLLQKRPWLKEGYGRPGTEEWEVIWMSCTEQGDEAACGVFMLMNALFVSLGRDPSDRYGTSDVLFFRQFVAAVICMGELPQPLWAQV